MWSTVRSVIDVGLQGQASRLMLLAQSYKDRTIADAKQQAAAAGVTAALVLVGLIFTLVAVLIGLAALYLAVAMVHGTFAGLAAAGGAALVIALLMFTVVAIRANAARQRSPDIAAIRAEARDALRRSERAAAALGTKAKTDAVALSRQTIDAAAGVVRNGSRETLLATLAATAIIGMLIGRSR
ncbi:MAG TPA: hypothetical protein VNR39_14300 [Pseudolabrys sp.]|nr:hypothetical protein [Pseudolabrys sp.]